MLVAIDDASLKTLEPFVGRWPWPRDAHAVLLDFLRRAGARLVVFDLLFTERDANYPQGDAELARATRASGNVIHSFLLGDRRTGEISDETLERYSRPSAGPFKTFVDVQLPIPEVREAARALGNVAATLDSDGPLRRYHLFANHGRRSFPSLALVAALAEQGRSPAEVTVVGRRVEVAGKELVLDADYRLPIWFNGGPGTYPAYSFGQLFASELQLREGHEPGLAPELFADKIVLVGLTAEGLHDLFTTPYTGGAGDSGRGLGKMHGVEVHANVLDDLLHGRFLRSPPRWLAVLASLCLAFASVWLTLRTSLLVAALVQLLPPAVWVAATWWAFASRWPLPLVPVLLAWAFALVLGLTYQYGIESTEKRRVKRIFSRYVSPDVYRELLADPEAVELGGSRREMTVLFSDLRGFTTFSEDRPPEEVLEQLNEYFAAMVEVIFDHRGTVDKFVGDLVMALFGAPLEDAEHAEHAVGCAQAMQRKLVELNREWRRQARPELASGIGINSGEMVVGNVGSQRIQSYTVIGDAVNLAARIESLCKTYETEILISEHTAELLAGGISSRELGEVEVKGKARPVTIHAIDWSA